MSNFPFDVWDKRRVLIRLVPEVSLLFNLHINFEKNIGKTEFFDELKKYIMRYKRTGYNRDVMRQSACLVVNPIMV